MSRVLVIEDDADQAAVRQLILEHAGHEVTIAHNAAFALDAFTANPPEIVLLDLHLKHKGDGLELVRELRRRDPRVRIIVVSGWVSDLSGTEEAAMVDAVIPKPARSERLLTTIARLAMLAFLFLPAFAASYDFRVDKPGEAAAEVTMSSPGANWAKSGSEAAMADLRVDDGAPFNVMLYAGDQPFAYSVFLGRLEPGAHRLTIEQNRNFSAPAAGLTISNVVFRTGDASLELAHAPVLYARANTIGRFTDAPMTVYAEQLRENGDAVLQYTVIFTNEDGGTSTRALMARWGRTTDIEYVYRLNLRTNRAIIQSKDHKDIEYQGKLEGGHPLLMPITNNNMVGPVEGEPPPVRYQIAPILADLGVHSREHVMDERPVMYRIMAEELAREGKLRQFGTVEDEKVSDPRNYLYVEMKVRNSTAGVSVNVRLRNDPVWRSASLGRADYAISRSERVRTTVELPPGTRPEEIAEIGFECVVAPGADHRFPLSGECRVEAVTKAFLLDRAYRPGSNVWTLNQAVGIPAGQMRTYTVREPRP